MRAAAQPIAGTMRPPLMCTCTGLCWMPNRRAAPPLTTPPLPRQFHILGTTLSGQTFRPSDWAERLAGAMSSFRPGGATGGIGAYIGYSPYCMPQALDGVKCVLVNEALKDIEPMAWDFVMNFARDNQLKVLELGAPAAGEASGG
jgi:Protein of unknown function (DUF3579)